MSALRDAGAFLAAIMPALVDLGRALFGSTGGDPAKARRVIRSHAAELRAGREKVDARAARKFGR